MLEIPGYRNIEILYKGRHSIVCRAEQESNAQPQSVVIKLFVVPPLSYHQENQLHHEFHLRQRIVSEHVVKYLDLKSDATFGYLLIEEDDHAAALNYFIPPTGFALLPFLHIAIQLTEGLVDIHRCKVIHQDIKPSNVIYNPVTGQVKYIDFHSATFQQLQHETTTRQTKTTKGTFAYISPEQTGRINRRVDYRSDFYSLGVTFYQLICGRLPFETTNLADLIHCHLAKQPLTPFEINPRIAKSLSEIIMKLLQKDANARYQSAYGLLVDLKRCQDELIQKDEITPFILAEHDFSDYFQISQKLYGRDAELLQFTQALQRTHDGHLEIVMIKGAAGIGKTNLAQEIQPLVTVEHGSFLTGKFEFLNQNIAYAAINQAFQGWVKGVLTKSETEIAMWKTQLLSVLGNQGQLLINVIPDLELILGKQPSLSPLDAEQNKNRFHSIFQQFIGVIAQPTHPLVLFLDDWQWADAASLALLESVLSSPALKYVLLIGAYRDNEVNAYHPSLVTLNQLQKVGIPIQTIGLSALTVPTVNQWLAESLHDPLDTTLPLATLIYQKTEGAPLYIKVFLQMLYEQQLLTRVKNHWQWDLNKIRQLPVTENVIDFMILRLQQLPLDTQATLQIASCMSRSFSLHSLHLLTQKKTERLDAELKPLLENGLLLLTDNHFYFAHDRIREAIYHQIPKEKRVEIHLTIGRWLKIHLCELTLEQELEVTHHLNLGKSLITNAQEQLNLVHLNFQSAQRAKSSAAYVSALHYMREGEALIEVLGSHRVWQEDYSLAFDFYKTLAKLELLNGNLQACENYLNQLLHYARTLLEKAEIYSLRIVQKTSTNYFQEAIDCGLELLDLLGTKIRPQEINDFFAKEFKQVKENFKITQLLLDMPRMTNETAKCKMKILDQLFAASILSGNTSLQALLPTMMVNLSMRYGNTEESPIGYSYYGVILITQFNEFQLGHDFGKLGIQLSEKLHHLPSQCKTNFVHGWIQTWRIPFRQAMDYLNRAQQVGLEAGELSYLGYVLTTKNLDSIYQGKSLVAIASDINMYMGVSYIRSNSYAQDAFRVHQLAVCNLRGKPLDEESKYEEDWKQKKSFYLLAHALIFKGQALYLREQFTNAQAIFSSAQNYSDCIKGQFIVSIKNFYHSLVLTSLYTNADPATQRHYWQQVEENQKQLKSWAESCPNNFKNKYLLVAAELARLSNKQWEAAGLYDESIQCAKEQDFIHEQALANELAAKFWLSQRKPHYVPGLLHAACQLYEEWGATQKVDQLKRKYSEDLKPLAAAPLSSYSVSGEEDIISTRSLRQLDLTSVLKTSHILSSEVDLNKLLINVMSNLIKTAGAQKGVFFMESGGNWIVQAEYTLEGQIQTLQQQPLSQWEGGAHSIVEYVIRTQKPLLIGNASIDTQFNLDPHIALHHLQSILCIPIMRHQHLKSILYLENNLAPYIFSEHHLQILQMLAGQIAISLENATLFESMRVITEQLNLALRAGNIGTWSWHIRTNKLTFDDGMYKLLGVNKETFSHTLEDFLALLHPEDRFCAEHAIRQAVEQNKPYYRESRIIRPDDKSIRVLIGQGKVYHDSKGLPDRMMGATLDITQRKCLEEERLCVLKQAEEKERQRAQDAEKHREEQQEFADTAYHEMLNPLSGICGCIDEQKEALADIDIYLKSRDDEKFRAFVDIIKKNTNTTELCARHQDKIIKGSLNLSKLEPGKTALSYQQFQPRLLIEEVLQICGAQITKKHLNLQCCFPEIAVIVKGDAEQFKSVVMNLVSNAVKYTDSGYVKVSLQAQTVALGRCDLTLCVEDTGKGISRQQQSRLFQRFSRPLSSQFEESIGLGLYITKKTIDLLGGTIAVESEEGKGAKFAVHFTFESVSPEENIKPAPQAMPTESLQNVLPKVSKNILVVEDNVINQMILKRLIEQAGYLCAVANNGLEALAKCEQLKFDLIFMDVTMPVMGGLEATKKLREKEKQSGIAATPIVGASANVREQFANDAKNAGMNAYITKPYVKAIIYETINRLLALNVTKPMVQAKQQDDSNAMLDSDEPISRHAIGRFQDKDMVFDIFKTKSDGSCGFYSLPIPYDRAGVVTLLMQHLDNNRIRSLIATEIIESFKSNYLPQVFYDNFPQLTAFKSYQTGIDIAQAELLGRMVDIIDPARTQIKYRQFEFVVHYLQQKITRTIVESGCLEQLLKFQQDAQAKFNEIKMFCQSKDVVTAFIQEYIAKEGRLSFTVGGINFAREVSLLDAILECAQPPIRLIIWDDDPSDTARIAIVYEGGNTEGTITHVYHRSGRDTHFELMAETSRPLYSLLPAAPKSELQTTAQAIPGTTSNTEKRMQELEEHTAPDQEKHEDKKLAQACVAQGLFSTPPIITTTARNQAGERQSMDVDSYNPPSRHGKGYGAGTS